ncbi:hypothetical protein J4461_00975 [Candidatus Pacearchaeota archaeon]|nr:hypothetical protein [Candidatus Pacearchaeota archaeon]
MERPINVKQNKPKEEKPKASAKPSSETKSDKPVQQKAENLEVSPIEKPKASAKPSKKEEAIVNGLNLSTSKKHCMYIGDFIKGKSIDIAIAELSEVLKFKRAIPFRGEIPHRHGDMMSGRYPIKAIKFFIPMLKGLRGNSLANGLDLEKTKISFASPSWASRPRRRGGERFKRVNVVLKAMEMKDNQNTGEKK